MDKLSVTLIDVGWGDSILIETQTDAGNTHFGLIDCNDTEANRSAYYFIKRHLEKRKIDIDGNMINDFIILSHPHADHMSGLKRLMRSFRTKAFWYPKSSKGGGFTKLIKYANTRKQYIETHQAIDNTKVLPDFGNVKLKILWPPFNHAGPHDLHDENNNSIVLALTLGDVSFILTGDCEVENWNQIIGNLPPNVGMFKVPHHGAVNGMIDGQDNTPWLDALPQHTNYAISSHVRPFNHPAPAVVNKFTAAGIAPFRTDEHYHLTFTTEGALDANGIPVVAVKWSHG
ncbi:MAG: MBL fold metallo-hydrolase [Chloroflexota bacterium]